MIDLLAASGGHRAWQSALPWLRRNECLVRSSRPTPTPHLLELYAPGNSGLREALARNPFLPLGSTSSGANPVERNDRGLRSAPLASTENPGPQPYQTWLTKTPEAGQQAPDPHPGHSPRKAGVFRPFTGSAGYHVEWPPSDRAVRDGKRVDRMCVSMHCEVPGRLTKYLSIMLSADHY